VHRADAIAPDRGKEVECVARSGVKAILKPLSNRIGIGEQVVEVALDRPAFDRALVEAERQG